MKQAEPDPFSNLPSLAEWADGLDTPYTDTPDHDPNANPEIDTTLRLQGDRRIITPAGRRLFRDYRAHPDAYACLDPLPKPGETLHAWLGGKYSLWEIVPALVEHKGKIADLWIATLSYSANNAADLLQLFDDGHVKRISLCISYYFRSTSPELYAALIPQLRERKQRCLSFRNHCKLILARMESGETYSVSSSANLRSSQNTEALVMSADRDVYDFHASIMDELLATKQDSDHNYHK